MTHDMPDDMNTHVFYARHVMRIGVVFKYTNCTCEIDHDLATIKPHIHLYAFDMW